MKKKSVIRIKSLIIVIDTISAYEFYDYPFSGSSYEYELNIKLTSGHNLLIGLIKEEKKRIEGILAYYFQEV